MRILAVAALAIAMPAAAYAHHGWESYDASKQTKITGTIAEVKWENPHAMAYLNHDGKRLEVYLAPLARMDQRGLKKEALAVGKTVTIDAQPSTKNANEWKAVSITVDGANYDMMR